MRKQELIHPKINAGNKRYCNEFMKVMKEPSDPLVYRCKNSKEISKVRLNSPAAPPWPRIHAVTPSLELPVLLQIPRDGHKDTPGGQALERILGHLCREGS